MSDYNMPNNFPKIQCEVDSVDVLSVLNPTPNWVSYRDERFGGVLEHYGITHESFSGRKYKELEDLLRRCDVGVVLNETWQLSPTTTAKLADEFPNVQFVSLTHGSPVHIEYVGNWGHWHLDFIKLSQEKPNCFYGHVMNDGRFPSPPGAKIVSIPNVAMLPKSVHAKVREITGKPRIMIAGRNVFIKNFTAQIAAAIFLNDVWDGGIEVSLMSNCQRSDMAHHIDFLGQFDIQTEFYCFDKWKNYLKLIDSSVDLMFAASLTESFGLIPVESMMMGIPVMGSYAVEFLPDTWQANPQDPASMADIAKGILESYSGCSMVGIAVADEVCEENEERLICSIGELLR